MSPDDNESPLPENLRSPDDGSEEFLAGLTPEAVEIQPIGGTKKSPKSENGSGGPPGRKRGKKVHAPDPKAKPNLPELPLSDEPGIGELPDLPALRLEAAPEGEEPALVVEELSTVLESMEELPGGETPATEDAPLAGGEPGPEKTDEDGAPPDSTVEGTSETAPGETGALTSPAGFLSRLDASEKKWLLILLGGLFVVGACFYLLLRSGLPSASSHQALEKPDLPIRGEKVTIQDLQIDWKDEGSGSLTGGMKANTLLPRISLRFAPGGSGAVRIFFKDEREQLVGDTVDIDVAGGIPEHVVTCTAGLRSRLEYDALRARDTARWTVDIYEGPKPGAPLSQFKLLRRLVIPWNLDLKSSP